jgi:hypothetical protein
VVPKFGVINFSKLDFTLPTFAPEKDPITGEDYYSPDSSDDEEGGFIKSRGRKAVVRVSPQEIDTLRKEKEEIEMLKIETRFSNTTKPLATGFDLMKKSGDNKTEAS